ncbi:MAG TPA: PD-(D/E)XK nuclease family protein, partial [Armatimonadota bacterium]|nr:PD-(D/E)XK nuclease family protein [Armatimonadota bacterium]
FIEKPLKANSPAGLAEEARERFSRELAAQEVEMAGRPRERGLPKDPSRVHRATEAVLAEAQRWGAGAAEPALSDYRAPIRAREGVSSCAEAAATIPAVEVEAPVQTADGAIRGRVDRVERESTGIRIVDYKSALRDDLPDRYVRQVQLYALMWHDTRGEWPVAAEVVYPLTGTIHSVSIPPPQCEQVGQEAKQLIGRVQREPDTFRLATPGDVCKACDFRPWCRPFWKWQADESSVRIALDLASLGFEGKITGLEVIDRHWRVQIAWRRCTVTLTTPEERLPQLRGISLGTQVRVLDANLHGLRHQPRALMTELSEVFIVRCGSSA